MDHDWTYNTVNEITEYINSIDGTADCSLGEIDASNEDNNQASDVRFDGCGTLQEKFYWCPVAPTMTKALS